MDGASSMVKNNGLNDADRHSFDTVSQDQTYQTNCIYLPICTYFNVNDFHVNVNVNWRSNHLFITKP
jgi:hypothetical protein